MGIDINELIKLYPTTANEELADYFGVSKTTIARYAKRNNLKKDKAYLSSIYKNLPRNPKKGKDHYRWKGGKTWERFKDPLYIEWRKLVLERDNYICQHCERHCKKHEKGLAAHHIKPYATYPDLRLEVSNGLTLCRQCHATLHKNAPSPPQLIPCACGCGTMISSKDIYGRARQYVNRHSRKGKTQSPEAIQKMRDAKKGKVLTPEHRAKIANSFRKGDPSTYNHPTMKEQNRHRSNNRMIEFRNETKCVAEWSEITGIHHATITTRLRNGWDVEDALTTLPSKRNSKRKL